LQNQASDASKADVNIPKIHWPLDAASASMTVPGSTPPGWCRCPSGRTVWYKASVYIRQIVMYSLLVHLYAKYIYICNYTYVHTLPITFGSIPPSGAEKAHLSMFRLAAPWLRLRSLRSRQRSFSKAFAARKAPTLEHLRHPLAQGEVFLVPRSTQIGAVLSKYVGLT
jgi:hypothetical protein